MKKIYLHISLFLLIYSCNYNLKKNRINCEVINCEEKEKIMSVHDEINRNRKKYLITTSCGTYFFSNSPYSVGNQIETVFLYKDWDTFQDI